MTDLSTLLQQAIQQAIDEATSSQEDRIAVLEKQVYNLFSELADRDTTLRQVKQQVQNLQDRVLNQSREIALEVVLDKLDHHNSVFKHDDLLDFYASVRENVEEVLTRDFQKRVQSALEDLLPKLSIKL